MYLRTIVMLSKLRSWLNLFTSAEDAEATSADITPVLPSAPSPPASSPQEDKSQQTGSSNLREQFQQYKREKLQQRKEEDAKAREQLAHVIAAAEADPKNKNFAFSSVKMFVSKGLLDTDALYPTAKLMHTLSDRLKRFVEEWNVMIASDMFPVETRLVEVARVLEVFQRRSVMTAGFIRDKVQDLANEFYYDLFVQAKGETRATKGTEGATEGIEGVRARDNYLLSLSATQCLRQNNHAREVAQFLASIVQDESLDEQTRIEMADNLELNCPFAHEKQIATDYIDLVVGSRNTRTRELRNPIKNVEGGSKLPKWLASQLPDFLQPKKNHAHTYHERFLTAHNAEQNEDEGTDGPDYEVSEDSDLYQSSQNVHKPKINDVVLAKLTVLQKDLSTLNSATNATDTGYHSVMREFVQEVQAANLIDEVAAGAIIRSITRISTDASKFDDIELSLAQVFKLVFYRVKKSKHKDELLKRMVEELIDTAEYCSTGYVSRLVNVLSGFDDVDLVVKFQAESVRAEVRQHLLSLLHSSIEREPDEALKEMLHEYITTTTRTTGENVHKWLHIHKPEFQSSVQSTFAANVFDEQEMEKLLTIVDECLHELVPVVPLAKE
jgi:hypothetical protein